ncbi:unnamed protein product, partial [Schistocephalus solidus]|uniref:BTB domain-containing protein n=1 Tax=Schistocephalus solidus TaxID=70667 RepID=A0A183TPZ8_SCHSO
NLTSKEPNNENFCIDHSGEIAAHISELFNNKSYSDISLVVKSTEFPAHRVILASRSEYFRALFYGGLAEAHSSTVHLNGISDTAFYHILCYIYTGKLNLSGLAVSLHEDVLDILGLACQYNFVNLQAALSKHFTHSLTLNNICSVYDAAIVYDLEELVLACLEFMDRFAPTILSMPQFERLSKVSADSLIILLLPHMFKSSFLLSSPADGTCAIQGLFLYPLFERDILAYHVLIVDTGLPHIRQKPIINTCLWT